MNKAEHEMRGYLAGWIDSAKCTSHSNYKTILLIDNRDFRILFSPDNVQAILPNEEIMVDVVERFRRALTLFRNSNEKESNMDFHYSYASNLYGRGVVLTLIVKSLNTSEMYSYISHCEIMPTVYTTPGMCRMIIGLDCFLWDGNAGDFIKETSIELSSQEKEIIIRSIQGSTISEMAKSMCKSVAYIKLIKGVCFSKLGVKSTREAFAKMCTLGLF